MKLLNKLEKDKLLHFTCSLIIFFLSAGIANLFHLKETVILILCALFTFGVGVCKEIMDSYKGGEFDFKDLIADWLGILVGIGLLFLIYL